MLINSMASKSLNMTAYPPTKGNKQLADAIKQLARLKFGRDRSIVESEILERTKLGSSEGQIKTDMIESSL